VDNFHNIERIPRSKSRRGSGDIGDVQYKEVTSLHKCIFLGNNISELHRADCTANYKHTPLNSELIITAEHY